MRTQNREFYSIILPTVTEKLKHDSWHKDWDSKLLELLIKQAQIYRALFI